MGLNIFSVVGESLNFSARRFETVFRVTLLPLALFLILNMVATFGYLSIANERIITFKDVADSNLGWARVSQMAAVAAQAAINEKSAAGWTIYGASSLIGAILFASFMAALVRYAGLGEKPAPGIIRAPFGADQLRFLLTGALSSVVFIIVAYAPIFIATTSIVAFVSNAMTTPFASFPDAQSLHTIEIVSGADRFGVRWLHHYQVWGASALAAALVLVAIFAIHFRRPAKGGRGFLSRLAGVIVGVAAYFAIILFLYALLSQYFASAELSANTKPALARMDADAAAATAFGAAAFAIAAYFGLRLFPYAGIATCRRSMSLKGVGRLTRGFNIFRLAGVFLLLGVILVGAQILLQICAIFVLTILGSLASAVRSLVNISGDETSGAWVYPFFGWLWAMFGIIATMLWTAFTYGVHAGLWGRLYRESQREV